MGSQSEESSRALAFMAAVDEGAATQVQAWRLGTALITPELPRVWDANYFRVERPTDEDGELAAAECVDAARAAGLAYSSIVVTDEEVAAQLRPRLAAAEFEETRFVLMGLREPPPQPTIPIVNVSFDDVAPSRRQVTIESFPGDDALADQLRDLDRRLEATIGGRWFAVREGGELLARAWLLGADGVGQVEDVATTPAHRGRGLARSVVSAAALASLEAGNELTFVIANDTETTPELYRKTGFEPIAHKWRFTRKL